MKLTVDAIMALDPCDARWFLARALSVPNRVVWAEACAERARGYADAADAANAARYAASNAEYAEYAAEYAANAAQYADAAAEHRKAVEHGVRLMGAE